MQFDEDDIEIKTLLRENQRLLVENNKLLRQMRRGTIFSTIFRIIWFIVVISVPLYVYFYYIKPNWDNLSNKIQVLEDMTKDVDKFEQFINNLNVKQ